MYYIYAPIGSFGNHLRWLLLLSDRFEIVINDHAYSTIDEKMAWLLDAVYPQERSWHNWLEYEWRYRKMLDSIGGIRFTHDNAILTHDEDNSARFICTTIAPELAYRSYMKFNNNLNNLPIDNFEGMIWASNRQIDAVDDSRVLKINSELLWSPQLDRTLYLRATDWFQCDTQWTHAVQLHERWFSLQQKAEREFVRDVVNLYGDNG